MHAPIATRLALLAVPLLSACAGRATTHNALKTRNAYLAAAAADAPDRVYALLAPGLRRRIDRVAFRRQWHGLRREIAAHGEQRRGKRARQAIRLTSRLTTADGLARTQLVDRRWLISDGLAEGARHLSPTEALAALLRAMEARDYRQVLSLLSPGLRQSVERELQDRADRVRSALGRPQRVRGDRATIELPGGPPVELSRQRGTWIITRLE